MVVDMENGKEQIEENTKSDSKEKAESRLQQGISIF